jgi:hypothetical protein
LTRTQNGISGERVDINVLALVKRQSNIDFRVDGFSNQNLGGVGLGDKAHQACSLQLALYLKPMSERVSREKVEAILDMSIVLTRRDDEPQMY